MSCISEILKIKGDKPFIRIPEHRTVIEDGGIYKGYEYLVTFIALGSRCGYVALPSFHPLNKMKQGNLSDLDDEIDCHGGVTFFKSNHGAKLLLSRHECDDTWVGFDCAHAGDEFDLYQAYEYFKDDPLVITEIKANMEAKKICAGLMPSFNPRDYEQVRTKEFVISECKKIIDQLSMIT